MFQQISHHQAGSFDEQDSWFLPQITNHCFPLWVNTKHRFQCEPLSSNPASIHASRKPWMKHLLKPLPWARDFPELGAQGHCLFLGTRGHPSLGYFNLMFSHWSPFTTPRSFTPQHSHGQMFITLVSPSNYFAGVVGVAFGRHLSTHTNTGLGCCVFGQINKCN